MDQNFPQYGVVLFVYFLALSITISLLITQSDGRYLRPSDHGLSYQDTSHPTNNTIAEMISFFNGGKTVTFPEAKNFTGAGAGGGSSSSPAATWWNYRERRRSRDDHKNHVREILLVTSLVCGLSGVVLLVVSAFWFVLRSRWQREQLEEQRSKQRSLSTSASTSSLPSALGNK